MITKVWPAQERQAIADTFNGGIPAAMAQETAERGMGQHFLLRCPFNQQPTIAGSVCEPFRGKFLKLCHVENGVASECDVDDRVQWLLVEPFQTICVLSPEMA
nr:hypothetical protein PanWU01x14_353950 [Ipomoea batatas]